MKKRKKAKKQNAATLPIRENWLPQMTDDEWSRLQVYPDAVRHSETRADFERRAKSLMARSGRGNLMHLCTLARVSFDADRDSREALAEKLLHSDSATELIYLAAFLRRRQSAVVEFFDDTVTETERDALHGEVVSHSPRKPETPKPFTKLAVLYSATPKSLESIHYRHAWRRLPTVFAYTSDAVFPVDSVSKLSSAVDELVASLDKLKSEESYELFGKSTMPDGLSVFVIHRQYPPAVRADYLNDFQLQHNFSPIAFSVDVDAKRVSVKVANRAIAGEIRAWVSETLGILLTNAGSSLFREYEAKSVEEAFLGGYAESAGVDLLEISFSQSFGPNRSPFSISADRFSRSVREDLAWLRTQHVVRLRSLSDISSLKIRYAEHQVDIHVDTEDGGAIRFKMNDSGLSESLAKSIREAFEEAFLVPLDRSIDPTLLAMGPADIYHFLLGGVFDHEVADYQKESLARLIELRLLEIVDEKRGRCTNLACSNHVQFVTDVELEECPTCQSELNWETLRRYEDSAKARGRVVRDLIKKATGWKVDSAKVSLESHGFHRIHTTKEPGKTVCLFINDRLNSGKMETFHRAMFPVFIVHPTGNQRVPVIDAAGIAHVGLSSMIAASESPDDWKRFKTASRRVVAQLLSIESERVLRASRLSQEKLMAKPVGYDDRSFELDIFNLLRSLFPYTVKWGGGNKPDGFTSLVFFQENDLSTPQNFNWSYDAKFTESTYPFGITEFRQMFDYVRRLSASKQLKSLGNRYDAHVIITNSMEESAMKNAAEFMATQHRIGQGSPNFKLAFMLESFLTTLWDRVRSNEEEFGRRSTYLSEYFVEILSEPVESGYYLLGETEAEELVERVLEQNPVEDPVDADKIQRDLRSQMKRKSKSKRKQAAG